MGNRSQRGRRELDGIDSSGWDGDPIDYDPVPPAPTYEVLTVGVANLGFGYSVNDEMDLDISGFFPTTPARVRVTSESGGSIDLGGLLVINGGDYPVDPNGQACDFINVIGSGATANGTVDSTQVKP